MGMIVCGEEQMEQSRIVAPFVIKVYQMVSDPSTDHIIGWGRANNSFVVFEPLDFSHRILPFYFKHNNFSSFVRQLNTYGFRKVDPDKWEFANEWFLRGQNHLLRSIRRRKYSTTRPHHHHDEDLDNQDLLSEIERLREEQKTLDEDLKGMNRRLEATERRPQQMLSFLCKFVEDPDILPRVIMQRNHLTGLKRRRRLMPPCSSSSSSGIANSENDDVSGSGGGATPGAISSPNNSNYCPSPDPCQNGFGYNWVGSSISGPFPLGSGPIEMGFSSGVEHIPDYMTIPTIENTPPPSYPFSLFGGGF